MSTSPSICQEVLIESVTPQCVYNLLLDSQHFSQMSGGAPATIANEAGGEFSLFGGMISGRNVELVKGERIVQAWRPGNWQTGVYSIVKFEITSEGDTTRLVVEHTGFPEENRAHLESGWTAHYLEPIKAYMTQKKA